jgi:SpoVK/Ycf46/Vps4 family AAA+-type ATPase
MVDCLSYSKMVPAARQLLIVPHQSMRLEKVPEEEVHFCAPTVFGYSFAAKKWGRFAVDKFTDIQWNAEAFDHLVLSEEKKTLIKSIIYADQLGLITDIVTNKAGGFIVLLHGNPGTGKTLTAEAASEKAQKPLMMLSAAELGFKAVAVELNLRNILEICKLWNAVLLIDEAEVILEERAPGDIQRNGMVSVLLRLLEYHQQVIFLTTNHITRIDPAVRSRIGAAIEYPDLNIDAREQIWTRFLEMGGVEISEDHTDGKNAIRKDELHKLATHKLNGRYKPLNHRK